MNRVGEVVPSINTSPLYGNFSDESKILTSVNKILESEWVPAISYFLGWRLSANLSASIGAMFLGGPSYGSSFEAGEDQDTGGSSMRAGAIVAVVLDDWKYL